MIEQMEEIEFKLEEKEEKIEQQEQDYKGRMMEMERRNEEWM